MIKATRVKFGNGELEVHRGNDDMTHVNLIIDSEILHSPSVSVEITLTPAEWEALVRKITQF